MSINILFSLFLFSVQDAENVYAIGTHVEKVHLPSGNSVKVSKLSSILKEVVAINNNYDGNIIAASLKKPRFH